MDISQYIFAPWQRQAELQNTQAATAMQQMQMAAYPEQQKQLSALRQAEIEQHQMAAQAQKQQMTMNAIASWQALDKMRAGQNLPSIPFEQFMQSGGMNVPPQEMLRQQPAGAAPVGGAPVSTPQQAMSAMAGGAPQVGQQGQMIDPFARISQRIASNDAQAAQYRARGYPEEAMKLDTDSVQHAEKAASAFSSMQAGYNSQAERAKKESDFLVGQRDSLTSESELDRLRKSTRAPDGSVNPMLVGDLATVKRRLALQALAKDQEASLAEKNAKAAKERQDTANAAIEGKRKQIQAAQESADYAARARNIGLDKAGDAATPREPTFAGQEAREKAQAQAQSGRSSTLLQGRAFTMYNAGEAAYDSINNLANAPAGVKLSATAGLAGKSGEGLVEAMTSTFARSMTPVEQRALQMDITGAIRQMLRFQAGGFATGVTESAIKEFNQQLTRTGDNDARGILNAMMLARLTQEYSGESRAFRNHPGATKQQYEAIESHAENLKKTFPMTVKDVWSVINKIKDPQKRQTISQQNQGLLDMLESDIKGAKSTSTNYPTVGDVRGEYRFKGGDPSKKENWEKI